MHVKSVQIKQMLKCMVLKESLLHNKVDYCVSRYTMRSMPNDSKTNTAHRNSFNFCWANACTVSVKCATQTCMATMRVFEKLE